MLYLSTNLLLIQLVLDLNQTISGFIPAVAEKQMSEWQIFKEEYEKSYRSHSGPSSAPKLKKQLKPMMTDRTGVLIDSENIKKLSALNGMLTISA
jgi:sortase (surface protein transpeptidase)